MKRELRFVFTILAVSFLAAAVLAMPATHSPARQDPPKEKAAPDPQTVSGKIASVTPGSFTLEIGSGFYYDEPGQGQKNTAKTMAFTMDKHTTVDGDLKVGAQADVTYRTEDGKNVAMSVRVSS